MIIVRNPIDQTMIKANLPDTHHLFDEMIFFFFKSIKGGHCEYVGGSGV